MKNRWNSRIKLRGKKNSNEKDLIEKFSQKEVGKDNIKEYLWDMQIQTGVPERAGKQ